MKYSELKYTEDNLVKLYDSSCSPLSFLERIMEFINTNCVDKKTMQLKSLKTKIGIPKIFLLFKMGFFLYQLVRDIYECLKENEA